MLALLGTLLVSKARVVGEYGRNPVFLAQAHQQHPQQPSSYVKPDTSLPRKINKMNAVADTFMQAILLKPRL